MRDGVHSSLLDDCATAAPQTYDATVLVRTTAEQAVFLDEVLGTPERPRTFAARRDHCRRWRGLLAHLRQAHAAAQAAQATVRKLFEKHRRVVQREFRTLRSVRYHVKALLLSRPRLLKRMQILCEAYQTAHARYSEVCSRTAALDAALTRVEQALAQYEAQWLTRIEQGLEAIIHKRGVALDTVVFAPLEAVYSDLLDAVLRTTEGRNGQEARSQAGLRAVLLRTVLQVTRKGLGEMLQTSADPGAILTALADEQCAYASPLWGGNSSAAEPRYRFVVLPPVAAADLAELRRTAEERHFGATLVMAETVAAGCCVVTLAFFPVSTHDEVLPPVYTSGRAEKDGLPQVAVVGVPWASAIPTVVSVLHMIHLRCARDVV